GVATVRILRKVRQHARNVLERLALEQAGEQQVALLPQGQLLVEVDVVAPRQEAPGLELDQGRGDQQELGRDLEIEVFHQTQLGQVGIHDRAERHLIDVHLLT